MKSESWKVAVIGDGGVGKTALAVQYTLQCFIETYDPTIEDSYVKHLKMNDTAIRLEVYDTAGQDEYQSLRNLWLREADCFIIVYSITSKASFVKVAKFHSDLMAIRQNPVFLLVGNQVDRITEREVFPHEGLNLARRIGCRFLETSAKNGHNVQDAFTSVVHSLRRQRTLPTFEDYRSLYQSPYFKNQSSKSSLSKVFSAACVIM